MAKTWRKCQPLFLQAPAASPSALRDNDIPRIPSEGFEPLTAYQFAELRKSLKTNILAQNKPKETLVRSGQKQAKMDRNSRFFWRKSGDKTVRVSTPSRLSR
jgi:hypothetical protein